MKRILLATTLTISCSMAIIIVEPRDIEIRDINSQSKIDFSFDTTRGNSDTTKTTIGAKTDYSTKETYSFILGDYSYGEASNKKNIDKYFIHTRFLKKLYKKNVWEIFAQAENNKFQNLKLKTLLGAGIRFKTTKSLYTGIGLMTVREKSENNSKDNYGVGNFYISYKDSFGSLKVLYNGYYQPHIDDERDYGIIQNLTLTVPINKSFDMKFSVKYQYDSTPSIGIKKRDISQSTSLSYKF